MCLKRLKSAPGCQIIYSVQHIRQAGCFIAGQTLEIVELARSSLDILVTVCYLYYISVQLSLSDSTLVFGVGKC